MSVKEAEGTIMDEEQGQFCCNCKRNVGAAIFATHTAFCQRNIKICDEPIPKNSIKDHAEKYHISAKCEKCNASVKKSEMLKHQEVCPKRLVTCEFCKGEFIPNEAEQHIESCGSRTELCECCAKYIMLKDKKKHFEFHQYEENFHRGIGPGDIHKKLNNELISKISEKSSQSYSVCHLCTKSFLWSEYDQHLKSCGVEKDFRKCPRYHENIPPVAWKDHIYKNCRMLKDSRTQVLTQSESISASGSQTSNVFHEGVGNSPLRSSSPTSTNPVNKPTNQPYIKEMAVCSSQSSYAIRAELTEDDQGMKCPFCQKQFHLHVIQEHIDSCSEKYFQCDLCCEKVLREDRNKHISFQCKMLQDKISSDLFECPLCGEQLLEKDKSAHYFLGCKTLFQDDGPFYSLRDENTSKNYTTETKKRIICVYCDKELHIDASEALHLRDCEVYKLLNSIKDEEISKYDAKETKKTKICAYCDKELQADASESLHLKDCEIYKQINSDSIHVPPKTHHDSTSVDKLLCIICIDNKRDIVFQPCGHLVVCNDCAKDVKSTCPMCRKCIKNKIKAYIN